MLTFILITAIAIGFSLGANALFFKKKPCGKVLAVFLTAGISILSAVIGLIVSALIIEAAGYEVRNIEKAVGPSITVAIFAVWGTLRRLKKGDSPTQPGEHAESTPPPPALDQPEPSTATLVQQAPPASQPSKRVRVTLLFAGACSLIACAYPPMVLRLDSGTVESYRRLGFDLHDHVDWRFIWESTESINNYTPIAVAWDHLALELVVIAIVSGMAFLLMKDGKWPLR